jgi:hypothetical protein
MRWYYKTWVKVVLIIFAVYIVFSLWALWGGGTSPSGVS